jgi:ketosteroid isomerase-like protein
MKSVIRVVGTGSLIIIIMIAVFGCSGSSNDGASIHTVTSADIFTMTEYFPLTSNWETDKWTLFIDQREHEIKGVSTKGMVDTQGPYVLYWTNDANGLRLHGAMKDDGTLWLPSTPLIIADPAMKAGDKKEGRFIVEGEEFQYVSELSDMEDVSVPAGNFSGCLKFRILIYPAGEDPNEYGSETIWLAEDVGFVKGETEENAGGWILTRQGETRNLLSYFITPSNLPSGPQGIKDMLKNFAEFFEREDLDGIMSLSSDDYLDSCVDKVAASSLFGEIFTTNSELLWFSSPGDIESFGDVYYATKEKLRSGMDEEGRRWWEWDRRGIYWREESGEWRFYGNQVNFKPSFLVFTRNDAIEGSYLAISTVIRDCNWEMIDMDTEIDDLTIIGPPSTDIDFDLKGDWNPTNLEYFRKEEQEGGDSRCEGRFLHVHPLYRGWSFHRIH